MNVDPKPAAKSVDCINTSTNYGTRVYNCDRNFRMGNNGQAQAAAGSFPLGNHGLCPYFYNAAFSYDFVPNNYYGNKSYRPATNLSNDVIMGYRGNFSRTQVQGDVFIATAKYPPFVVLNGVIDNQLQNILAILG